jgi:hypothetical protein
MFRLVFTSFLLVVAMGGGWLLGQQQTQAQPNLTPLGGLMTGSDVGIRVDGKAREGKLVGTLMVRLKSGEWMEVYLGRPGVVPLESR